MEELKLKLLANIKTNIGRMTYMLKKLPQVHNSYIQILKKQQRLYISVFLTKSTL